MTEPEFSRPLAIERVRADRELVERVEANEAERAALARRLDLVAIDGLAATLRLRRRSGGVVTVRGTIEAEVVQTSVVTLDPLPTRIHEDFAVDFVPGLEKEARDAEGGISFDPEAEIDTEPLEGGSLDLGELSAQYLSLALDPYPRGAGESVEAIAPGVVVPEPAGDAPAEDGTGGGADKPDNPFDALKRWRPPS